MLNLCDIVAAILKMATTRNFSMSCPELILDIGKGLGAISAKIGSTSDVDNFQNGRHNIAQIQHCPISTTY
jgi:hypothetical protein